MPRIHKNHPRMDALLSRFDTYVKPYYGELNTKVCPLLYKESANSHLVFPMIRQQAYEKFGFLLICDDVTQDFYDKAIQYGKVFVPFHTVPEIHSILEDPSYHINIFEISPEIGLGAVPSKPITKGTIIAQHFGEVSKGKSDYYSADRSHAFVVSDLKNIKHGDSIPKDSQLYDPRKFGIEDPEVEAVALYTDFTINTTYISTLSGFFFHCDSHSDKNALSANLVPVHLKVPGEQTKIVFVSTRDIKPGEPLCFNHNTPAQDSLQETISQPLKENLLPDEQPGEEFASYLGDNIEL